MPAAVTVFVMDTGFDPDAAKEFPHVRLHAGFNMSRHGSPDDSSDPHGHGTAVARTLLEACGPAPIRLVPVRLLDRRGALWERGRVADALERILRELPEGPTVVCAAFGDGRHLLPDEPDGQPETAERIRELRRRGVALSLRPAIFMLLRGGSVAGACPGRPAARTRSASAQPFAGGARGDGTRRTVVCRRRSDSAKRTGACWRSGCAKRTGVRLAAGCSSRTASERRQHRQAAARRCSLPPIRPGIRAARQPSRPVGWQLFAAAFPASAWTSSSHCCWLAPNSLPTTKEAAIGRCCYEPSNPLIRSRQGADGWSRMFIS